MKILDKPLSFYLELSARIYAFSMLMAYGTGKIAGGQFYRNGALPDEVAKLTLEESGGFDLAWTFFGYSEGYIWFIGGTQIIGALLLLFNRTKLIGVAILIPVLVNIIAVDYFFQISTGALLSAISYLTAMLLVVFVNRDHIKEALISLLPTSEPDNSSFSIRMIRLAVSVGIMMLIIFLEVQMLNIVGR